MVKILRYSAVLLVVLGVCFGLLNAEVFAEGETAEIGFSLTDAQKSTIVDHCDTIKNSLKSLQKVDSRTRVYLGRYYETILSNFITPLNLRLVENNISNPPLLENQTNFAARRDNFVNDFIVYQQALEELVKTNCKDEPMRFYEKLVVAREKRAVVNKDVTKLRGLTSEQIKLVEELKNGR